MLRNLARGLPKNLFTRGFASTTIPRSTANSSIAMIRRLLVGGGFVLSAGAASDFWGQGSDKSMKYQKEVGHEDEQKGLADSVSLGVSLSRRLLGVFSASVAHACGIIAYIGEGKDGDEASEYLLEGLSVLQNRGYDSAGIATLSAPDANGERDIFVTKKASVGSTSDSIELLRQGMPKHKGHIIGIGHTRWATHGAKTDNNAHPHMDEKGRIAVVHNGTISNYSELKKELKSVGITFRSETDTEVIANIIGHNLDKGMNTLDAVTQSLGRLEGTWGLVVIARNEPDRVIAARNGSPLVVGIDENRTFVASEVSAFARHTSNYISLKDGEIAVVKADISHLDLSRIRKAPKETIELSPDPYPHWTIKEINEQPEAIARVTGYGGRFNLNGTVKLGGLDDNIENLSPIKNLLLSACGTSYYAALYGTSLMKSLGCFNTVQVLDASEVVQESFPKQDGGFMCLSQSGETKDTHRALVAAMDANLPALSVVNQVGSLIARTTGCGVYLNAGRENAVASTKAFTTQVAALALIATWFSQISPSLLASPTGSAHKRAELVDAIHRLPIYCGMALKTRERCRNIAQRLKNQEHMFVLGKGYGEPIALEGALKLKEMTYIHAEGYSGGALKHGPFALLQKGTPVIHLILDDRHASLMSIAAHETKTRGAHNIIITDNIELVNGKDLCDPDDVISLPRNGPLSALLAVIPLQMLAYELSIARGINPDKPRNLAKSVTVD